jgi:translation initiation factor 3 subunit J
MRLSMTSLKGAEAKEISSSVTAIANEKIKADKEAAAGKKRGGETLGPMRMGILLFVVCF